MSHASRIAPTIRFFRLLGIPGRTCRHPNGHARPAVVPSSQHRHRPVTDNPSARPVTRGVLQTLCGLRRVARSVAITFSLLPLLLYTAGACGAFPEFDSCPERLLHAQQEHASSGADHHGAHQGHSGVRHSHPDLGATHADSPDDDDAYCACCQGFFLAHLSALPAAVTVPVFPCRSVDHSGLHRMALESASAPPTPPPKLYPA